ncbi:MAG: hypothetical protein ISS36_04440 [Candidatus Aenigmarchaeota archaeon]|nr:hypothetical protein [Candidatus Aenigmarchaeota archaeon]
MNEPNLDWSNVRISIAGIRGVWEDSLTPRHVEEYVSAFVTHLKERKENPLIGFGGDPRDSYRQISDIIKKVTLGSGTDFIDFGITATPSIQHYVSLGGIDGGICISASHNPPEYAGLKPLDEHGFLLDDERGGHVLKIMESGVYNTDGEGVEIFYGDANSEVVDAHIRSIARHELTRIGSRGKKLKVVVDGCNGGGSKALPKMLENLYCDAVAINCDVTEPLSHGPGSISLEPSPENMKELSRVVVDEGADFGISVDPDADRLAFVNERGEPMSEEYTLGLATYYVFKHKGKRGWVVTNLSTSNMNRDIARQYDCNVYQTKIGETYVRKGGLLFNAVLSGEGNGGVILPELGSGRDTLAATAILVNLLRAEGRPISEIVRKIGEYCIEKRRVENFRCKDMDDFYGYFVSRYDTSNMVGVPDLRDGVRIDFNDNSWVQVRPSNTEPIVRVFAEANERGYAKDIVGGAIEFVSEYG